MALLLGAAMWQAETENLFRYRGQARSAGPWDNPNTFGMLMGVGLVLAVGKLVQSLKPKVQIRPSAEFGVRSAEHPTSNIQHPILNWGLWVKNAFFLGATAVMGVGLVKSYSRGASVGAAVGLAYLIVNAEQKAEMGRGKAEKLNTETLQAARRRVALAIIAVSIGVLAFWSCRHTERALARRAYTVANANDFSWRNRVVAYEGALQMLAEKPWFGFGWNQPERVYDRYYRAAKVDEGMAIQLNDYLTLGTTLGLPALLCFATYIGLSLSPRSKVQSPKPEVQSAKDADQQPADGRQRTALPPPPTLDFRLWTLDSGAVCRAGAAVLLVGFWFDGGLFKLATGSTFWILLELGKAGTDCTDEQA